MEEPVYDTMSTDNNNYYEATTAYSQPSSQPIPLGGNPCYDLAKPKADNVTSTSSTACKFSPQCFWCCAGIIFVSIILSVSVVISVLSFIDKTQNVHTQMQSEEKFEALLNQAMNRMDVLQDKFDVLLLTVDANATQLILNQTINTVDLLQDDINIVKEQFSGHHLSIPATSCLEILQNSPSPFSGYYWIRSLNGSAVHQYCDMSVFVGIYQHFPASSCLQISSINSSTPSGYYWLRATNGSATLAYCEMELVLCGNRGWMSVTDLQFTNGTDPCPSGLQERGDSGIRTCGINSTTAGCYASMFDTFDVQYNAVCGKIIAYQFHHTDAFGKFHRSGNITIDSNYVDGISLTHGRNPRKHIWTFAAALDEHGLVLDGEAVCQCSHPRLNESQLSPTFIGQDYFCDSAVRGSYFYRIPDPFYSQDPLWDGAGCGANVTCCSFNDPPWFHKLLPSTTSDDIEMRTCRDEIGSHEDIAVASVEIYVQ